MTAKLNINPADGPPMLARLKSTTNGAHGASPTETPRMPDSRSSRAPSVTVTVPTAAGATDALGRQVAEVVGFAGVGAEREGAREPEAGASPAGGGGGFFGGRHGFRRIGGETGILYVLGRAG